MVHPTNRLTMHRQQQIIDLIDQLENLFSGSPWYGPTWMESLERIPVARANYQLAHGASLAGILGHVVAWRAFVAGKLGGDEDFELEPGMDWPDGPVDDQGWQGLIRELIRTQEDLLEALTEFPASRLEEQVPGRDYHWRFMIQGLIDHDVYHLGQINLLAKQIIEASDGP